MKKYLAVFTAFSLISTVSLFAADQRFEDKPAEGRAFTVIAKPAGAYVGGMAGGLGAAVLAAAPGAGLTQNEQEVMMGVGAGAGMYAGVQKSRSAALSLLARWHGVSKRVEEICLYYNININQYRPILTTAELKNSELLLEEIDEIYPLRFGESWKESLNALFKKYKRQSATLLKIGSFKLTKEGQKTFARMVELGATISNLYYGTDPQLGNAFRDAKRIYKKLGLLQ